MSCSIFNCIWKNFKFHKIKPFNTFPQTIHQYYSVYHLFSIMVKSRVTDSFIPAFFLHRRNFQNRSVISLAGILGRICFPAMLGELKSINIAASCFFESLLLETIILIFYLVGWMIVNSKNGIVFIPSNIYFNLDA